jgi:hypothetical protein
MSEASIQTRAVNYARRRGIMAKRNYMGPGAETGWPDVEFFTDRGGMFFIEFKRPGGKLRRRQAYITGKLMSLGHAVFVCDDYEQSKRIIDDFS